MIKLVEYTILDEDLDSIYSQYYSDIPREEFDKIIAIDPTFRKQNNKLGSYGKWLLTLYKKGDDLSDEIEIKDMLGYYNSKKNKLDKRDINVFKTAKEFLDYTHSLDLATKSEFQLKADQVNGAKFICKNGDWEVYQPLTFEASKFLRDDKSVNGYDANWCTGYHDSDHYWRQYTRDGGELFIFFNLHATNEFDAKYQVCVRHGRMVDFRDARDDSANFASFLSKSGLIELIEQTQIAQTKEFRVAKTLRATGGKLTYSELMGIKYLGEEGEGDSRDVSAFYNAIKDAIKIIIINDGIKSLPAACFANFKCEKIIMPDSVQVIGSECFMDMENLKSIHIGAGVSTIPTNCFYDCTSLEEITFDTNVIAIGKNAFHSCSKDLKIKTPRHKIKVNVDDKEFILSHLEWTTEANEELEEDIGTLTEKIGARVPQWFKDYFFNNQEETTRSWTFTSDKDNILRKLSDAGININTMKIVPHAVPDSPRNEYMSDRYIQIYYLSAKKMNKETLGSREWSGSLENVRDCVYIAGVNAPRLGYYSSSECAHMSKSRLLLMTTKFATIDKEDPNNNVGTIRLDRAQRKEGSIDRVPTSGKEWVVNYYYAGQPHTERNLYDTVVVGSLEQKRVENDMRHGYRNLEKGEPFLREISDRTLKLDRWETRSTELDKSGYNIVPIRGELRKKLAQYKKSHYLTSIDNLYRRIENAKNKIQEVIQDNLSDMKSVDVKSFDISGAYHSLSQCISIYQQLMSRIDYITLLDDEERKEKELEDLFTSEESHLGYGRSSSSSYNIKDLEDTLKSLETYLKSQESTYIEELKQPKDLKEALAYLK